MNRHGETMKVIFLDIDGVLNSSKTVDRNFDYPELDPRNLAVLQEIVSKTDAVLVLISSWKDDWLNEDGTVDDQYRIDYFDAHFREMYNAIYEDGVDLMGYTSWGCIDLVSERHTSCQLGTRCLSI